MLDSLKIERVLGNILGCTLYETVRPGQSVNVLTLYSIGNTVLQILIFQLKVIMAGDARLLFQCSI